MKIEIPAGKKDTKLPAILAAALKLFVKHGIEGTTTKEIARHAQVAEGALYRHFKSKEDLAWHLFASNLKALTTRLLGSVLALRGTRERIDMLVRECLTLYERDRALFHFLLIAEHRELKKYKDDYTHPGKLVEQVVREGQESGELRPGEPMVLFSIVLGTIHRLCVLRSWGLIRQPLTELVDQTVDVIWSGVRK